MQVSLSLLKDESIVFYIPPEREVFRIAIGVSILLAAVMIRTPCPCQPNDVESELGFSRCRERIGINAVNADPKTRSTAPINEIMLNLSE